jgi:hypothetical protein
MSFTGRDSAFDNKTITNDGFFPSFSLGDFNAQMRIDVSLNQALLESVLWLVMAGLNRTLAGNKAAWIAAGFNTLEAVPNPFTVRVYLRVLFCRAKAVLLEEMPAHNHNPKNATETPVVDAGHYIQQAEEALCLLRGTSHLRSVLL